MIRDEIRKSIEKTIKKLGFEAPEVLIEKPKEKTYGDYATNVAMMIAKQIKKNPMEIAKMIDLRFKKDDATLRGVRLKASRRIFDKIEVVQPGFINFFLSGEYLQEQVKEILRKKEKFGISKIGKKEKINIEFISANPTGPLTLGNGRGGFCGDVLANVLEKAGYKVCREYYINDVGEQIKKLGHSVIGDSEAVYTGKYINTLRERVKEENPEKTGEKVAEIILQEMIKPTVKKMRIDFAVWFSEKSLYKSKEVDKILNYLKKKNFAYKKDGALWFKSTNFGDDKDRVLIKEDGEKTYLASDFAYLKNKFKRGFKKLIFFWGADHHGYVDRMKAAIEVLSYKKEQAGFILMQLVRLFRGGKEVRMSKRSGIYVTIDELIDEVGLDVARFFFLTRSSGSHLNFDMDLAKKQSTENPVYYVQYAHARICSIIRKSKIKNQKSKINFGLLGHPSELALIKQLIKFPEIIEDTAKDYQVQRLPQYAVDLADSFHRFYENCRVISDDKNLTQVRLSLVLATKIVLKNTLDLMGISAPEKM